MHVPMHYCLTERMSPCTLMHYCTRIYWAFLFGLFPCLLSINLEIATCWICVCVCFALRRTLRKSNSLRRHELSAQGVAPMHMRMHTACLHYHKCYSHVCSSQALTVSTHRAAERRSIFPRSRKCTRVRIVKSASVCLQRSEHPVSASAKQPESRAHGRYCIIHAFPAASARLTRESALRLWAKCVCV